MIQGPEEQPGPAVLQKARVDILSGSNTCQKQWLLIPKKDSLNLVSFLISFGAACTALDVSMSMATSRLMSTPLTHITF